MSYIDFWLIRHAPVMAQKGLLYGWSDLQAQTVDELGQNNIGQQIMGLKAILPSDSLVFVSDLMRTEQTRKALGLPEPFEQSPALREQNFGTLECSWLRDLGADHEIWKAPHAYRPAQGESWQDLRARVVAWFHALDLQGLHQASDRSSPLKILIVGHAGSLRALLAHMLNLSDETALSLALVPLSLSQARFFPQSADEPSADKNLGSWRVNLINWQVRPSL